MGQPTPLSSAWTDSLCGLLGLGTWENSVMGTQTDRLFQRSVISIAGADPGFQMVCMGVIYSGANCS